MKMKFVLERHPRQFLLYNSMLILLCMHGTLKVFPGVIGMPEYISNFGNFTDHLVHILETSEPTEHKPGVHLYTPFSIGYLMANVYENLWPVPVKEVPEAIFTLKRYVATDYAALLRLFKKRQFRISSTIYTRFGNVTKPQTFPQLLTQVISLDLQKNRTEFRDSLKEILDRGTRGHLDNEMLPEKDPAWREIFDNTTHGVYANTLHYKSEWDKPWKEIGNRKFFDNANVPFLELEGVYPYAETENASATIIKFQASTKEIILFKPRDFMSVTDMRRIVRGMLNNESLWKRRNVTIQMPALNVTNLSQPSDKFPFLGVTDTFCRGRHLDPSQFYFNQHPIAHANHFEFSTSYLEVASSSGSIVSFQNNRDFLSKPPANQSTSSEKISGVAASVIAEKEKENEADYFDILEAAEEEDERFQDYIVDARSNLPRIKEYRAGEYFRRVQLKNRSNKSNNSTDTYELDECDALQYLNPEDDYGRSERNDESSTDTMPTSIPTRDIIKQESLLSSFDNTTENDDMEDESSTLPPTLSMQLQPAPYSAFKQNESEDGSRTLVLDTPFSWILRDKEIGEVFYGSVSSLCQYNRAIHHIPTVPVWVLDLFKAFYWRCV